MEARLEKPFTREGLECSIECLDIHIDDPQKESVYSYHYHEFIELLYAISPGAIVWINGKCHKFNTGQLAIINSREVHTVTYEEKAQYICVKFSPQILYSNEQALFEFKYMVPFLTDNSRQKIFDKDELQIENLMIEILDEWQNMKTGYELILRANILKISAAIFRHWQITNQLCTDITLTDTIKKALPYIAKCYSTATEKEVANVCGLSYNHFSYIFKKTLGKSFSEYITLLKLQEAEKLLLSTEMSVTEIAYQVGFSSASHFISRFRDQKKITPKQFKEKILRGKVFPF